ncbi:MAG TPA: glutamate-1-semialdehyde 2,1-aminomutase [Flavobacteriales bacterium]|nr:glutamate-1-semialdehyde 2,1-aminomutase [Flavobacteriales bacterium]HPH82899.1 glutamate-1-semialdehyde 2,1-aminomutase [Flavobacteriales bacterium]
MNRDRSAALFETAKTYFPGGVNSPVRAFKSVGGTPVFIKKGDGCRLWDEDGNEFIDFCFSWGPMILGHNNSKIREKVWDAIQNGTSFGAPTQLENELAHLILSNNRFIEKLRFVSSGTEAVMSAIRLARGVTGRDKILKFEGCYHGHVDSLLVKAGSGLITFGNSSSAGVPKGLVNDTIVVPLNRIDLVEKAFEEYADQLAAVIIEPIPANNGLLQVSADFLRALRTITQKNKALLIFDEVISGFRVGFEGAAGLYDISPDIITYGKIIGGGFPVGAYGASKEIMGRVSPDGDVYQAGTLSGNPVAMAGGIAALTECLKPGFYEQLQLKTERFTAKILQHTQERNYPFRIFQTGSIFWLSFASEDIHAAEEIDPNGMSKFKVLHAFLLENGVYFGPSGYEVGFISSAHNEQDLEYAAQKICEGLDLVYS